MDEQWGGTARCCLRHRVGGNNLTRPNACASMRPALKQIAGFVRPMDVSPYEGLEPGVCRRGRHLPGAGSNGVMAGGAPGSRRAADGQGYFGEALDITFRLLDSPQFKARLRKIAAPLIMVVSGEIYRSVVRHQYDGLDQCEYHPEIEVQVAGNHYRGYVHVPADAFESLTVDSATGAIVPPATPFFNQLERHLIQTGESFDLERGLADLKRRLPDGDLRNYPSGRSGCSSSAMG